ncbi:hypothetical protein ACJX0J_006452, partial [Zea mays]
KSLFFDCRSAATEKGGEYYPLVTSAVIPLDLQLTYDTLDALKRAARPFSNSDHFFDMIANNNLYCLYNIKENIMLGRDLKTQKENVTHIYHQFEIFKVPNYPVWNQKMVMVSCMIQTLLILIIIHILFQQYQKGTTAKQYCNEYGAQVENPIEFLNSIADLS